MAAFENVTLELVRPGPPHNQLLSPLTPYMALCGEGSPVTFHINLEHHKLLNRLRRLRYISIDGSNSGVAIPDPMREAEVIELGEQVASILGNIQTLNSELSRAQGSASNAAPGNKQTLVHLRLIFSGSELSLIPFELAASPQAFPGEGLEFCLQASLPIVITREIRRSRPIPVAWDRPIEPRILFISAEPATMAVPKQAHVVALRKALEPWIRWPHHHDSQERATLVKERLRLLINPCVADIYNECASGNYTHIHILAHGASYEESGEQRFGLALCHQQDKKQVEIVSGKRLAKALQAELTNGPGRSQPLVVTLATCDSGNPGSPLTPGGSIAHNLHSEGIPWVFASQFPLTKTGSVRMVETLYPRLLHGDDPRKILYEVRRQLFMTSDRDHDWASIVTYGTLPANTDEFSNQVFNFFERQMRRSIEVSFDRADNHEEAPAVQIQALDSIKRILEHWRHQLPTGNTMQDRSRRAHCYGLHGSAYKRIALHWWSNGDEDQEMQAYDISWNNYKNAMNERVIDDSKYYWIATQYLCLSAVIKHRNMDEDTYRFVRKLVKEDIENGDKDTKTWAHGTMAELELLSLFSEHKDNVQLDEISNEVCKHCSKIVEIMGAESFHAKSTARQFQRYIYCWLEKPEQKDIAATAIATLSVNSVLTREEFPTY
ncbi:MAG: CHAT domain-containing protein [Methylococcales bacterium]